ncbi:MAG: hypothetical protein GF344_20605 [Chitinivibrionales bacterium]|nr:hypothetical protein [Chitinivibrionales bacterium]MBD3358999.1 hypothetical protein [Chitinivibrionales bacterium]
MCVSCKRIASLCLFSLVSTTSLCALDTTEPFDLGFSDNEIYVSFSGLGAERGRRMSAVEYVVGVGVTERFSTLFSFVTESDGYFNNPATELGASLFANVLDRRHLKLDISAGVTSGGSVGLGTELNVDFDRAGLQVTIEEAIYNGGASSDDINFETTIAPLVYVSLTDALQALASIDATLPADGDAGIGAPAVGLNAVISDAIEIISEVGFDIPREGEAFTVGASLGFVATLP